MINNVTRYIDLNNEKFRIKPKHQEDELLSSWLVRIARAHLTLTTIIPQNVKTTFSKILFS